MWWCFRRFADVAWERSMAFIDEELNRVCDRTSWYCHICHQKLALAFKKYGVLGARGAWEVGYSNPKAKGGTDRLGNLYPACISCNRSKGASITRFVRAVNGKSRAPMSFERGKNAMAENAFVGGAAGAAIGLILGPADVLGGALLGAHLGYKKNPDM
jgi:hypothetical protein